MKKDGKYFVVAVIAIFVAVAFWNHKEAETKQKIMDAEEAAYSAGYADGYNDVYDFLDYNISCEYTFERGVFTDSILGVIYDKFDEKTAEEIAEEMYDVGFVSLSPLKEQHNYNSDLYEAYKPESPLESSNEYIVDKNHGKPNIESFDMIEVDSSAIKEVGYSSLDHMLAIRFRENDGSVYVYYDVPEELYDNFMCADSLGKFYNSDIKGKYTCDEIEYDTYKNNNFIDSLEDFDDKLITIH